MQISRRTSVAALTLAFVVGGVAVSSAQSGRRDSIGDPPSRVGRLSDLGGSVSLYPAGATDWTGASLNYPLTTGDALWVDDTSRAEIHLGSSALRIGANSSIMFGEVSDTVTQVRLDRGSIVVYIRDLQPSEVYEVDTPAGVISLVNSGRYRIDVTPDGRRSTVTVRSGDASLALADNDFPVSAGQTATLMDSQRRPVVERAIRADAWEAWANSRDERDIAPVSERYVSTDMVGYQDLDQYGDWQDNRAYGAVWYPRGMPADWAPYRFGRWESIGPWGWTWMDDAPWGFAPFHYGRWASVSGRWGWVPGSARVRPVYAPALVAFIGGNGWSVGASFGGRPAVGWVPLAPQEPYIPAYRTSAAYVRRVNVPSVRVNVNVTETNINNIRYVNRDVPGAVTAVGRDDFVHSRPIGRTAVVVPPAEVVRARPSLGPVAGDERLTPPPRPQQGANNDRNGRTNDNGRNGNNGNSGRNGDNGRGNGGRPTTPPPAPPPAPTMPSPWHPRPRPDNVPPGDSRTGRTPAPPPPPVTTSTPPAPPQGRGRPPQQQPAVTPPAPPLQPPVTATPPNPPPADRDRDRGRARPIAEPRPGSAPVKPPVPIAVPAPPPVKQPVILAPPPPAPVRQPVVQPPPPAPVKPVVQPPPAPTKPPVKPVPPPRPGERKPRSDTVKVKPPPPPGGGGGGGR